MKRRKLFKTLGLASAGIIAGGAFLSSNEAQAQDTENKLIINRQKMGFADPEHPTDFEYKHTPDITFGDTDPNGFIKVLITIGQHGIIHPTETNHWIDYLKIYQNGKLAAHLEFENGPIRGYGEHYMRLVPGDEVKVESGCNLHGIWESAKIYS